MEEVVVFAHEGDLEKNGYGYAFNFYKELSKWYRVKVIVPKAHVFSNEDVIHYNPSMTVQLVSISLDFWVKEGPFLDYYDLANKAHRDSLFVDKIKKIVGGCQIIICDSFAWPYFVSIVFPGRKVIMRSLDVEQDKIDQSFAANMIYQNATEDERIKYRTRIVDLEDKSYKASDYILALTENDIRRLSELYDIPLSRFLLMPAAVPNLGGFSGFLPEEKKGGEQINIVFIGNLIYDNWNAFKKIIDISSKFPDMVFHIIGRHLCDEEWYEYEKKTGSNVRIYGVVSDEEKKEIIQKCDGALNLSTQTYGLNTKLLDYMLYGCPIISTERGVRGYELIKGEHYIHCEIDDLEKALHIFMNMSISKRNDMARKAYMLLFDYYDYEKCWKNVEDKIDFLGELRRVKINKQDAEKEYIIFGCGFEGHRAYEYLKDNHFKCIGLTDNNKRLWGGDFLGEVVYSPDEALEMANQDDNIIILIATVKPQFLIDIYRQVSQIIDDDKIEIFWDGKINPSEIDRKRLKGENK